MNRKTFTTEQIEQFRSNPYTEFVSASNIRFTPEFKDKFWQEYLTGKTPRMIFTEFGYDPQVLGDSRMSNLAYKLSQKHTAKSEEKSSSSREKELEARVKTLEFQIEALKKIMLLASSKKRDS